MNINQAPIKSVVISGNLLNNLLTYELCPASEFSDGVWNLCNSSISYYCKAANVNEICQISCNLVKSQRYNKSFEVETYDQPFNVFKI